MKQKCDTSKQQNSIYEVEKFVKELYYLNVQQSTIDAFFKPISS